MIQITPQMRVVVAVEPADFRKGIDGLARLCKDTLKQDPFSGWVFVFRNRRATALKVLVYDGQGFWLCHKRLSSGRFRWWPRSATDPAKTLSAHQLQVLFSAGNPDRARVAPAWRPVGPIGSAKNAKTISPNRSYTFGKALLCSAADEPSAQSPHQGHPDQGCPAPRFSQFAAAGIMKQTKTTIIELNMDDLEDILRRVEAKQLNDDDCEKIRVLAESYVHLLDLLKDKKASIARLQKMIFGASTEKTAGVVGSETDSPAPSSLEENAPTEPDSQTDPKKPRKGHGRNGVDAYAGAEKIEVPHESLQPGDDCPQCSRGTVYETNRPGVLVRITGQAPVRATVYQLQKLRCNLCGKVFAARLPEGVGTRKYDATAGSMVALLKYGSGLPFNRLQGLQGNLGIPLPASTQWDIVKTKAMQANPAYAEMIRQAAQGDIVYNDDTTVKILERMGKRAEQNALAEDPDEKWTQRSGLFTSGIVSTREDRRIALFFSGRQHAGENLGDVLAQRAASLSPPIQMCDALSRNLPAELKTIVAHCLAHGRRQFVDVAEHFPEECHHVLESLSVIYGNDALARERNLSPQDRLEFHQAHSGPTMEELQAWLNRQFDDHLVEPNSSLGKAIAYMLKHWARLTLFLRQPGAPLDNNICERALKKAILHRKNSLFYKTENGAHVGDVFMSLIYTCELCGANSFDYLSELDRHAADLSANPENWMPWNYRQTLSGITLPPKPTR